MTIQYEKWLKVHLSKAKIRYTKLCKLDDKELAKGGNSVFYEQAHQMFGYIAALEKCLKQLVEQETSKKQVKRKKR